MGNSEYTVKSSKEFVNQFRSQNAPKGYKLISFDVSALFTNVPLDYTIDLVLKRVYDQNEIVTEIPKAAMKEMLILCTKNVLFSFNNEIYNQTDGVAMGSPLGPVLANIFMVDLERNTLPNLSNYMLPWKRYVDDTIAWIKVECIDCVLDKLNNLHKNCLLYTSDAADE